MALLTPIAAVTSAVAGLVSQLASVTITAHIYDLPGASMP